MISIDEARKIMPAAKDYISGLLAGSPVRVVQSGLTKVGEDYAILLRLSEGSAILPTKYEGVPLVIEQAPAKITKRET